MKKLLISLLFSPMMMFACELEELKEWLHDRIWEYEMHKKVLTDSSDIYTYYMVFGKQAAYQDVLILIDEMEKKGIPPLPKSSESCRE